MQCSLAEGVAAWRAVEGVPSGQHGCWGLPCAQAPLFERGHQVAKLRRFSSSWRNTTGARRALNTLHHLHLHQHLQLPLQHHLQLCKLLRIQLLHLRERQWQSRKSAAGHHLCWHAWIWSHLRHSWH